MCTQQDFMEQHHKGDKTNRSGDKKRCEELALAVLVAIEGNGGCLNHCIFLLVCFPIYSVPRGVYP